MAELKALEPQQSFIQKTPGVCGGRACIRNTRITVWGLEVWRRLGLSDERIRQQITGLTQEDLEAAWLYCNQHRAEIDHDIKENEEA